MFDEKLQFEKLKGKVLRSIWNGDGSYVEFEVGDSTVYSLDHPRPQGEVASNYEFCGNMGDLIGAPILKAELSTCDEDLSAPFRPWAFYKLRTVKGSAKIRVRGELSGFYSVAVDFLTLRQSRRKPLLECPMLLKLGGYGKWSSSRDFDCAFSNLSAPEPVQNLQGKLQASDANNDKVCGWRFTKGLSVFAPNPFYADFMQGSSSVLSRILLPGSQRAR